MGGLTSITTQFEYITILCRYLYIVQNQGSSMRLLHLVRHNQGRDSVHRPRFFSAVLTQRLAYNKLRHASSSADDLSSNSCSFRMSPHHLVHLHMSVRVRILHKPTPLWLTKLGRGTRDENQQKKGSSRFSNPYP